jgi:signal peptidase II
MSETIRIFGYATVATTIFVIDRITKLIALAWCCNRYVINQFLACDLVFNRGISWGLLHSNSTHMFIIVSTIISMMTVAIAIYGIYQYRHGYIIIGELLLVSGSISNLIDRWYYSGVIDFIEISYRGYSWPLFNFADICIVMGACIMMIEAQKQ